MSAQDALGGRYTEWMKSVADDLRLQTVAAVLALPVGDRIDLALALGDDDAARFAAASGCDILTARRRLAASRQHGRTPSRSAMRDQ